MAVATKKVTFKLDGNENRKVQNNTRNNCKKSLVIVEKCVTSRNFCQKKEVSDTDIIGNAEHKPYANRPSRNSQTVKSVPQNISVNDKLGSKRKGSNASTKKAEIKKDLVRNCNVPAISSRKRLGKNSVIVTTPTEFEYEPSKFSEPEMHSVLNIIKEIDAVKASDVEVNIASSALLPPITQQKLEEKVANKLNFAADERLYTELVDLSVDEDYFTYEFGRKNVPARKKDKEPCLSDFFKPSGGKEYSCLTPLSLNDVHKIQRYNGFSVYRRSQLWEYVNTR